MKRLPRILQIIWMLIGAVSLFEAYSSFTSKETTDPTSGYLFCGVAVFAFARYFMLRRKQFIQNKKDGKFDK